MENMLMNFYNLCAGSYLQAIVLNNLYHEACQHSKTKDYTTTIVLSELLEHLTDFDCNAFVLINAVFVPLAEGMYVLTYKEVDDNDQETEYGIGTTKLICTINLQEIEDLLAKCKRERDTVDRNNRRASELGYPATLTLAQWMENLTLFHWCCAYCHQPYEVLEHIIPLTFPDSGTTALNCVPSCKSCNSLKGPYHPEIMPNSIREKIGESVNKVRFLMRKLILGNPEDGPTLV